ncbi:MAG TPA: amino acid permease C-terminal domain-containing protein, partial [Thermoanaerobaculia bacterium]
MLLRIREPERPRPFRVPFGPFIVPILGIICCVGLIVSLPPTSWWRFAAWLGIGMVFYLLYGIRHSRARLEGA